MLPHKVQKISLFVIGFSFLMLLLLILEKLDVLHLFGSSTTTLISLFSVLIYISIVLSLISSEREEDENTKNIRYKVASIVSLVYFFLIIGYKIIDTLFIGIDIKEMFPMSFIVSGKAIIFFFIIYLVILKLSLKKKRNNN